MLRIAPENFASTLSAELTTCDWREIPYQPVSASRSAPQTIRPNAAAMRVEIFTFDSFMPSSYRSDARHFAAGTFRECQALCAARKAVTGVQKHNGRRSARCGMRGAG